VAAMRRFAPLFGLRCAMICLALAGMTIVPQHSTWAQEDSVAGGRMVRGTVKTIAPDHLSIRTDAGDEYQVIVTDNTRIMKTRQPIKIAEIKPGDGIGAMGVMDAPNRTVHAAVIMVVDAAQVQKMKDDLGKTYILGKVTAIDDLKLTIQRPDGVVQVIAVDEGTSFRKGGRRMQAMIEGGGSAADSAAPRNGRGPAESDGESITLADVKIGNTVAGKGELKGGTFVPSELAVSDGPGRQRGRRQGSMGAGASPASPAAGPQ
jgi:hypothetical protein